MDVEAYPGRVRGGRIGLGHGRLLPHAGSAHVIVGNPRHMRIEPADPLSLDPGAAVGSLHPLMDSPAAWPSRIPHRKRRVSEHDLVRNVDSRPNWAISHA